MPTSGPPGLPTPPSSNNSGTPSDGGANDAVTEATARRLVLALELLRRQLQVGSHAAGAFANRDRTAEGRPHPAMEVMLAAAAAGAGARAGASAAPNPTPAGGDVTVVNPEGRPVPVVVVGWKAPMPGGPAARQIGGGVQDAEYKVIGGPKELPPGGGAGAPSLPPGQPAAPPAEPTPWSGAGAWNLQRRNFDLGAMKEALWRPRGGEPEPKKRKEPEKESGSGVAKALAGTFGRVLAPLVAFSTILSASNSGMSVFQKSVSVVATSLAPILLPPLILLSAGLLTISDVVWTKLRPHLAAWAELVTTTLVPAIEEVVDNFASLIDAIQWVVEVAKDPSKLVRGTDAERAKGDAPGSQGAEHMTNVADWILRETPVIGDISQLVFGRNAIRDGANVANRAGTRIGQAIGTVPTDGQIRRAGDVEPGADDPQPTGAGAPPAKAGDRLRTRLAEQRAGRANPPAGGTGGGAAGGGFAGNLNLIMSSLAKSLGPKAEYTTAAGAYRASQLAAANGDPLDMKALLRAIESVGEVQKGTTRAIQQLKPPAAPQVPPNGGN